MRSALVRAPILCALSALSLLVGASEVEIAGNARPVDVRAAPAGPVSLYLPLVLQNYDPRPLELRASFNGIDGPAGQYVPDPSIAAGTDSLILMTNASIQLMSKSGAVLATKGVRQFFLPGILPGENSASDVFALFDPESRRFFLVEAAKIDPQTCVPGTCVGHIELAVSKVGDPSLEPGDWYFYALDRYLNRTPQGDVYTTNWGDFDKLGVDHDVLVITSRMYRESDGQQQGPMVRLLPKNKLINGEPLTSWTDFSPAHFPNDFRGLYPAMQGGTGGRFFLVSGSFGCNLRLWALESNATISPTLSMQTVSGTGSCQAPPDATQPGGGQAIDAKGSFNLWSVYRNGSLWIVDAHARNLGSGNVSALYWAQINVSNWPGVAAMVQSGSLELDGVWNYYPAIAVDAANGVVVVFARSSASEYASLYYTTWVSGDAPGTLRAPALLKAGSAPVAFIIGNRNRYGDYFDTAVDPVDGSVWLFGEYARTGTEWGTWVGQLARGP